MRERGHRAGSDAVFALTRKNHLYRGVTADEWESIVRTGRIASTGRYSAPSEGTNFAGDAPSAEAYVNFGRDDPRITGVPTYLIEIEQPIGLRQSPDGYYKQPSVSVGSITRAWKMIDESGAIVGHPTRPEPFSRNALWQYMTLDEQRYVRRGFDQSDQGIRLRVPVGSFAYHRNALIQAHMDTLSGRGSKTRAPMDLWYFPEKDTFLLIDGYHRLANAIDTRKRMVTVQIVGSGYSDYWAPL